VKVESFINNVIVRTKEEKGYNEVIKEIVNHFNASPPSSLLTF